VLNSNSLLSVGIVLLCLLLPAAGCSDGVTNPYGSDAAIRQIDRMIAAAQIDKDDPDWRMHLPKPHLVAFNLSHDYYVQMYTSKGPILIRLMPDVTPMAVTNFLYLARLGFYDGLTFHRVIPSFLAQGGDPSGNGTGGPGYEFDDEFNEVLTHDRRGRLSMANHGPNTNGSQFFITFVPLRYLDGRHTVFGQVVEGMDTLEALEEAGSPGTGTPTEPLMMSRVTGYARRGSHMDEVQQAHAAVGGRGLLGGSGQRRAGAPRCWCVAFGGQ